LGDRLQGRQAGPRYPGNGKTQGGRTLGVRDPPGGPPCDSISKARRNDVQLFIREAIIRRGASAIGAYQRIRTVAVASDAASPAPYQAEDFSIGVSDVRETPSDPYLYKGTDCLRNKLGIRDSDALEIKEAQLVTRREVGALKQSFRQTFDLAHLCALHNWLFQDIYEWAGSIRTVSITKDRTTFALPQYIEGQAEAIFQALRRDSLLRHVEFDDLPKPLAELYGNINTLHPFREGNGRTQRLFFRHLLIRRGLYLNWALVTASEKIEACVASHNGDNSRLEAIFSKVLKRVSS
jgi:cell filamentation protein